MIAPILIWAGLLVSLAYLPMTEDEPHWPRSIVKTLPLLLFAYAGWDAGGGAFLVAGLFLSAFGDMALSRNGQAAFLYGLASFALAHILYTLNFMVLSGNPIWEAFAFNPILALFLVAFAVSAELWLIPFTRELRIPVRIYVVLITLMGLAALTQPMGMAFLGAAFFILSDTLLALQLFRTEQDNPINGRLGWAVWLFYIAGQLLILTTGVA